MARQPFIVNVTGLKKSGKTAVSEALIAELRSRGYSVGAVKTTHNPALTLDAAGTDSWRFAEAGAAFVVALLDTETHYFERRTARSSFREASRLFTGGVQIVVCEGSVEPEEDPLYVVCLKSLGELEETLVARGVTRGKILAISGPAAEASAGSPAARGSTVPLLDIRDPADRAALVDLVLEKGGHPAPADGALPPD